MVTVPADDLTVSLAATLREGRLARGLSVSALAERSGVSRAMIAKIERAGAQPTAALLGRLSSALGMTLSELVARAERDEGRLRRGQDQPAWTDPATGYVRRALSPATDGPLELIEITFPAGAETAFGPNTHEYVHQQVWILEGRLRLTEGETTHDLRAGDCLELGPPAPRTFVNPGPAPCRYLVAYARRGG